MVTKYDRNLHADVLITRILEAGGARRARPRVKLAALYLDQSAEGDLGRRMAAKHKVPIVPTIEEAITLGTGRVAVDGVLSIGEHGHYPWNDKGQHLYPAAGSSRRSRDLRAIRPGGARLHRQAPGTGLGRCPLDVPDRPPARHPDVAGSSLPLSYRSPELDLPMGCDLEAAVGVGHAGLDVYGIHTLELYQSIVERRRGGETGVRRVQCLAGPAIAGAVEQGRIPRDLLEAALRVPPSAKSFDLRTIAGNDKAALFLFDYADGLTGAVFMLPDVVASCRVAVRLKGGRGPLATRAEERTEPRYPHFAFLLRAVERMIHTGRPSYPVERTLLTLGILDRAPTSRSQGGRILETPELTIRYQPADYPHCRPASRCLSDPISHCTGDAIRRTGTRLLTTDISRIPRIR